MTAPKESPLKRLNRLRKLGSGADLADYAETNLNQNWKAIEDTFNNLYDVTTNISDGIAAASTMDFLTGDYVTSFSTTSATFQTIGTVVTGGGLVALAVMPAIPGGTASGTGSNSSIITTSGSAVLQFLRSDGLAVGRTLVESAKDQYSFFCIDPIPLGVETTYTLQGRSITGGTMFVTLMKIAALEMTT